MVRVWDINKSTPGANRDVYCTDSESKRRKAAREEGMTLAEWEEANKDKMDAEMEDADAAATNVGENGEKLDANSRIARPVPCVEYVGHSAAVHGVDLSPGHDFLLSCSRDQTIRVWSTRLEIPLAAYKSHRFPVWDVKWCGTGHYFASASNDCTARVWAMDESQPRRVMVGHLADVDCVAWHPNTNYIATGSTDRTVRLEINRLIDEGLSGTLAEGLELERAANVAHKNTNFSRAGVAERRAAIQARARQQTR